MQRIFVERNLACPIDYVFQELTDHANYKQFPGITESELLIKGQEIDNGTGARRRIKTSIITLEEDIVGYQPPNLMQYKIIQSSPVKINHIIGDIQLSMKDEITTVKWLSEFIVETPLIGNFLGKKLEPGLTKSFHSILKSIESKYRQQEKPND